MTPVHNNWIQQIQTVIRLSRHYQTLSWHDADRDHMQTVTIFRQTDLKVFVVVIPKEGWARVAAPILLLAWHRLFKNIIYDVRRVKIWKVGVIPKGGWARPICFLVTHIIRCLWVHILRMLLANNSHKTKGCQKVTKNVVIVTALWLSPEKLSKWRPKAVKFTVFLTIFWQGVFFPVVKNLS